MSVHVRSDVSAAPTVSLQDFQQVRLLDGLGGVSVPKCQTHLDSSHSVRGQQRNVTSMYSYLRFALDLPVVPLKGSF